MLVDAVRLDADHPLFLEIEVEPAAQGPFGVTVESGRAYSAHASGQAMLGWQIADDLRKHVGDRIDIDGTAARRGDHLRADRGDHRHEHHGAVVRGAHPFVERTREFGVLRAVGWSRSRLLALVVGEAVGISLFGAAVGAGLAFVLTSALEQLPQLRGVLQPQFTPGDLWTALCSAVTIGVLAALYPSLRAALLRPSVALRWE